MIQFLNEIYKVSNYQENDLIFYIKNVLFMVHLSLKILVEKRNSVSLSINEENLQLEEINNLINNFLNNKIL